MDYKNQRIVLKEMGVPHHLVLLTHNLYSGQEATGRPWRNRMVSYNKDVRQDYILSPYLLSVYSEHILKAGLDSDEGRIKIGGII